MTLEVSSVSRKPELLSSAAVAVSVLTGEDIHRSGATTLADALRYAPGLDVARVDGQTWAISARGFSSSSSNKLSVLMDGRSLYTPLFSGVLWDVQDTLLDDVDRIEVVRGPGATLWGANAVDGVISITTKSARDTQGTLVSAEVGTEESQSYAVRYGGEVDGKFYYRVYAKTFARDDLVFRSGADSGDDWKMSQGGFRMDAEISPTEGALTFQGDYYQGLLGQFKAPATPVEGGNFILRGTRRLREGLEITSQAYFDYKSRDVASLYGEVRDTWDFDTQVHFAVGSEQDIVSGINYRTSSDRTESDDRDAFIPSSRRIQTISGFAQDEITLLEKRLSVILGARFEYRDLLGAQLQPSVHVAWHEANSTWWAAISRAVRSPSRFDEDVRVGPASQPVLLGNPDFRSEKVLAYELGYRTQFGRNLLFDLSTYYNHYTDLRSQELLTSSSPTRIYSNGLRADNYGAELAAKWQVLEKWRLQLNETFLHEHFYWAPGSADQIGEASEANDPKHITTLISSWDLPENLQLDVSLRHVSALPAPAQPGYLVADIRLAWQYQKHWEFAVVGQNLFDRSHPEFGDTSPNSHEVQRSVYTNVTCHF